MLTSPLENVSFGVQQGLISFQIGTYSEIQQTQNSNFKIKKYEQIIFDYSNEHLILKKRDRYVSISELNDCQHFLFYLLLISCLKGLSYFYFLTFLPHFATLIISLTLRRLMSYIYIYIYIYMEHPFLMFLDHTQRRSTVGRTPLDE